MPESIHRRPPTPPSSPPAVPQPTAAKPSNGLSKDSDPRDERRPAERGVVRGHVVVAIEVLRQRIAEPWTLNSLADEVHLSRSQLARSFTATVGMSPMAYLRRMRVERMARLLISTDQSVGEAARSVGWADANYASRCFHPVVPQT